MSIEVHFAPEEWERLERDWTAWWEGELERPLVMIEGRGPRREEGSRAPMPEKWFTSEFPLETPVDEVLDHYQEHLERKRFHGDAWPRWWPNFGPGIAAGFLGAKVHPVPDTVWFEPAGSGAIEELRLLYDTGNPWWQRVKALTSRAVERWEVADELSLMQQLGAIPAPGG